MCYNNADPPPSLAEACRLVAARYFGAPGTFAYQAFDYLNATYFDGTLPTPLITWALTAHGRLLNDD